MTAAFEIAAGALAVIGVADIALRTGREVYGLLHNIVDAPNDIRRLCDSVKEISQVVEISRECLETFFNQNRKSDAVIESLNAILRSLNRELHSLRALSLQFGCSKARWNRVKYVLDKRKIGKSLDNIERSKTLLANAMTIVCRYAL